jgi:CMP-N,N'-diacetyllegionaminic acid synthase
VSVIALIPARSGSKGIPGKNFRKLDDRTLVGWAAKCAREASIDERWVSSDVPFADVGDGFVRHIHRPAELAQDDSPMIAVVRHALQRIPGEPDDIIVLLQPTQPFRKPEHVREAIRLLRETGADSVVSVVELPKTHSPEMVLRLYDRPPIGKPDQWATTLQPWGRPGFADDDWKQLRTRRQHAEAAYMRDGTCYAFYRKTVEQHGNLYGQDVRPLIIDPADTCELDTEADWTALERRWKERHG